MGYIYPLSQDADPPDKEPGRAPRQPPACQGRSFIRTSARSEHSAGPGGACREPPLSPPLASGRGVQAASSSGGHRALTQSISHPKTPKKVTLPPPAAGPSVLLGRGLALTQPRAMGPGQGTPRGRAQSFLEGSSPFWRAQSILEGSFLRCLASRRILARERRMGTAMGRKSGM